MNFSLNKTVAALGLIVASTSAMAESNVSIYGRVDTSVNLQKQNGVRTNELGSNGSHFGFRGHEDLGNGLRVGFVLESAFNSDTGAQLEGENFFANQSEVNLSGNFGTVRLGRFFNPSYYAVADQASLHNEDYGVTADALYQDIGLTSNRIAYTSPDMYGLTVETSLSFHEKARDEDGNPANKDKNAYDLAANYERGDWSLGAGYTKHGDAQQYALRATWVQDAWTVSAYHQRSQDKVEHDKQKMHINRIAVAYAMGACELHANYGQAHGPASEKAKQWTLGYNYHLSKRTKLYTMYTVLDNQHGANFADLGANSNRKVLTTGIRHNF